MLVRVVWWIDRALSEQITLYTDRIEIPAGFHLRYSSALTRYEGGTPCESISSSLEGIGLPTWARPWYDNGSRKQPLR